MNNLLKNGAKGLASVQRWIMFVCCVLVIVGLFAQVVLRYVAGTTLLGLSELILIPTLWMYFIGASYASAEGTHISADVLQVYVRGETAKAVIRVIVSAISLVIGLILSWWACLYIEHSLERPGATPVFGLPLIVVQLAVLTGFLLMTFYTALSMITAINDARNVSSEHTSKATVEEPASGSTISDEKEE